MFLDWDCFIVLIISLLGLVWIYGTWKNWVVLMDPEINFYSAWFWEILGQDCGEEEMRGINYFNGLSFLIGGVLFFIVCISL